MRTLYIFNYQREIPPFMLSQLDTIARIFDKVYYTSPSLSNRSLIENNPQYSNIRFLTFNRRVRLTQYFIGLTSPLRPAFWKKFHELGLSAASCKMLMKSYFCISGIDSVSKRRLKRSINEGDVCVMAAWFDTCAIAASRAKRRHPEIEVESFAHAFEIDAARDNYTYRAFAEEKHSYIDRVHFISRVKLDNYYNSLSHKHIKERFGDKIQVSYLGTFNGLNMLNPSPEPGVPFHIVTCSRTSPEKRLHLICETLSNWQGGNIRWTHIGTGPLDEDLRTLAKKLTDNNPLVTVDFAGGKRNDEVLEYYKTVPVDLFVNVSDTEGIPVSVMEAASFGIPCAATDVGGTRELVDDSMGWLLPCDFSPQDFCRQIMQYRDSDILEKVAKRASAHNIWNNKFNAAKNNDALWRGIIERMTNKQKSH